MFIHFKNGDIVTSVHNEPHMIIYNPSSRLYSLFNITEAYILWENKKIEDINIMLNGLKYKYYEILN
jgi:hypothetical protein